MSDFRIIKNLQISAESVLDSAIICVVLSIIFTILYLFPEHIWCLNFAVILRSYCSVALTQKNETILYTNQIGQLEAKRRNTAGYDMVCGSAVVSGRKYGTLKSIHMIFS